MLSLVCLVVAIVLFVIAAFFDISGHNDEILPLGLAFFAASFLFGPDAWWRNRA